MIQRPEHAGWRSQGASGGAQGWAYRQTRLSAKHMSPFYRRRAHSRMLAQRRPGARTIFF